MHRDLTDDERHMYIDLRPFMQRTPFLVHANASLSRTYRLFRTMGLHHVFVGPPKPMVMGVITRKVTHSSTVNWMYCCCTTAVQVV